VDQIILLDQGKILDKGSSVTKVVPWNLSQWQKYKDYNLINFIKLVLLKKMNSKKANQRIKDDYMKLLQNQL
jgi:hypothetical protein